MRRSRRRAFRQTESRRVGVSALRPRPAPRACSRSTAAARSSAAITQATINITSAGHVVTWRYHGLTLTEVATSAHHPLPQKRRLVSYRLKGEGTDQVECRGGARYQVNFQLEPVEPEVFWTFQQELAHDGQRQGMLYRFDSSGRMALGALELHQSRKPQSQPAGAGLSHLSRRLRDRQEPVALRDSLTNRRTARSRSFL